MAGPFAMGIGMMAANFIGSVFMHFYLARVANIDMLRFYREVFFAQFVPMSVVYASSGLMIYFFPVTGWGSLAVEGALYSFIFGAATWYGGTNCLREKPLYRWARVSEKISQNRFCFRTILNHCVKKKPGHCEIKNGPKSQCYRTSLQGGG